MNLFFYQNTLHHNLNHNNFLICIFLLIHYLQFFYKYRYSNFSINKQANSNIFYICILKPFTSRKAIIKSIKSNACLFFHITQSSANEYLVFAVLLKKKFFPLYNYLQMEH